MDAKLSETEAAEVYDFLARFYDFWSVLTEAKARRRALELSAVEDGEDILEVAVGTGTAFLELVKENPNGINCGVDISAAMLKQAEAKLSGCRAEDYELMKASAYDLPYEAEQFDLLFNTYMFDLIPYENIPEILTEFHRVLKEEGRIVVVNMTAGESFITRAFNQLHSLLYRAAPKLIGGCRPLELSSYLREAGFKVTKREYQQQLFVPSEVIAAEKR